MPGHFRGWLSYDAQQMVVRRQGLAQALERSRVLERPLGKEVGQGIGRGNFFSEKICREKG